jgi:voltage-gated potassium channel
VARHRRHIHRLVEARINLAYQVFMLFLCLYALAALSAEVLLPVTVQGRLLLAYVDDFICGVFFIDFLLNWVAAEHKWKYLRTWGWIDLLSSVPVVDALRVGRLARVLRIVRLLRALKVSRFVVLHLVRRRQGAALYGTATVAFTMVIVSSLAVLSFETVPGANIRTAGDALWWALCTIATVGYGDYYPVTWEGRAVAAVLMTVGVGLIGVLSGAMVSWFVRPDYEREKDEIRLLRRDIAELTAHVQALRASHDTAARAESGGTDAASPAHPDEQTRTTMT